jgi:lipopolysaccharide export system protein LptA
MTSTAIMRAFALSLVFATFGVAATAQTVQGVPNAMQGFSQNRDKPVKIDAASLEVRDKDRVATFSGDVKVTQGDTVMRSKTLLVFYEQSGMGGAKGQPTMTQANPGPGGNSAIRRLEAKGGVMVTQKDQTVTGETGVFDMKANTVTMNGGVVLTQGQNVLRGERLVVNLTTGVSRVEVGPGGRVQGVFQAGKSEGGSGPSLPGAIAPVRPDTKGEGRPDTKSAPHREPGKPLRLNAFPAYSRPAG